MEPSAIPVLLVIDNAAAARQIQGMLDAQGYSVTCAHDLSAAVAQLRLEHFCVVLLNPYLPDSKGLGSLGCLQAENPLVPIILLAGLDDQETARLALRKGAQDYLVQDRLEGCCLRRAIDYAIQRQHTCQELKSSSHIDPLTNLYNQRGFAAIAAQQHLLAERMGRRLCLSVVDIDQLAGINETMGRRQNDLAVIDTAAVLQRTFRSSDIIARLGPERFAILCMQSQPFDSAFFTLRLNKNIDEYAMTHPRAFRLALRLGSVFCEPGEQFRLSELLQAAGGQAAARQDAETSGQQRHGADIRVLLIEDNPGDARLVREMLSEMQHTSFTMHWVKSLAQGKDQLAGDQVDVVLLDLDLPDSWGSGTITEIVKCAPSKPVVVLTGSTAEEAGLEAIKFGAQDYLIKGSFTSVTLERIMNYAIERKNIIEELRRAREREVAISSRIQQTLLLGSPPADMPGLEFAAFTVPSQFVDGDFYDFFCFGNSCVDIIVGDVMGKGIPAALLGAAAKSYFLRAHNSLMFAMNCAGLPAPDAIIDQVNRYLVSDLIKLDSFITLCYARLDTAAAQLQFVDCGHTKIVHYRALQKDCRLLDGVNMPIGFSQSDVYKTITIPFCRGDLFFFYSDGLTEARSPAGDFFAEERIMEIIASNTDRPLEEINHLIYSAVTAFVGSQEFADDLTCVAVAVRELSGQTG